MFHVWGLTTPEMNLKCSEMTIQTSLLANENATQKNAYKKGSGFKMNESHGLEDKEKGREVGLARLGISIARLMAFGEFRYNLKDKQSTGDYHPSERSRLEGARSSGDPPWNQNQWNRMIEYFPSSMAQGKNSKSEPIYSISLQLPPQFVPRAPPSASTVSWRLDFWWMKYKGHIYHMYEHLRHLLGNQQEFTKWFLGLQDCEVSCHDYRILPWEQPSLVTLGESQ